MELSATLGATEAENRLVARARADSAGRSGSWCAAMTQAVRGLAFRLLEDREGMDDVLQEVYLKVFRALPGFRGHSAFGT